MTHYKQQAWQLSELFSGFADPKIEETIAAVEANIQAFEAYRPKLQPDMDIEEFRALLELEEEGTELFSHLFGYGHLVFAGNTQNQEAQVFLAKIGQLAASAQNRTLFFGLWWKELEESAAQRLLMVAGDLRYWLEVLRLEKPHTLSEAEEKILNIKNVNGTRGFVQLYDSITNRYTFKIMVEGEEREMTRDELSSYYRSADPSQRKAAYQELYRVYGQDMPILAQLYQFIVRDWRAENVGLRHYATPIAVRNRVNDIPDEVIELLFKVMRQNRALFHRYFQLKGKLLGREKLDRYDLYAPIAEDGGHYTLDEAWRLVATSFEQFHPEMKQLAERVFQDGHYDSEVRVGKLGGAFCATLTPKLTPYILQSFNGKANDVATMAHELGHAIHSMLAEKHSILTQQSNLPLAETASTFAEMLVVDKLLQESADPTIQRDLLMRGMDDAYATIMRQAYFAMFEREAHEKIEQGASADQLSDHYLALLREQLGEAVEVSDDFRYEWVAIPHFFHTPFYVYAYAFGQLLALSLYKRYQHEGSQMIPGYLALLSAGGSKPPVRILQEAGIDVYSEAFWQGGFDFVGEQLAQLEQLLSL